MNLVGWEVEDGEKRLKAFIQKQVRSYHEQRDMLAAEGTSALSPYLRFGLVSVRQCARLAAEMDGKGAHIWMNELIWRDFYATILFHYPDSATQEWNEKYRGTIEWSNSDVMFSRWQQGKTGYPVVDAAMRQLLETGWMHNRARMIVASFFTKHLLLDWRRGEEHFAQLLMDYDMASNVGGWQWAASTGTDAQPYFRIFNPITQGERFDPEGEYIRHWVPELRGLPAKEIHSPWKYNKPSDYPDLIVDHKEARQRALQAFKVA